MKRHDFEREFFGQQNFDKLKKLAEEKHAKVELEEKEKLKQLHYMHCPKCGMKLIEIDYKGILVDKCSSCQGVWLDAGEMEAISKLEKAGMDRWFRVFKK